MAPQGLEQQAGEPGASGRPGQTPRFEPRPDVIEEEEMQSPSFPITPPGRSPGDCPGGVVESTATSLDTSESGAAPLCLVQLRVEPASGPDV